MFPICVFDKIGFHDLLQFTTVRFFGNLANLTWQLLRINIGSLFEHLGQGKIWVRKIEEHYKKAADVLLDGNEGCGCQTQALNMSLTPEIMKIAIFHLLQSHN